MDDGASKEPFDPDTYFPPEQDSPSPVNWTVLDAEQAEAEWLELNRWVDWLRTTYALPASIVPPLWHRHWELVWELSALHTHWLGAYSPEQHGSAPIGWHRDFAEARERLRDWVATSGSKLDRDRPSRQTVWPGESRDAQTSEQTIVDRDADFVVFVLHDIDRRRGAEH